MKDVQVRNLVNSKDEYYDVVALNKLRVAFISIWQSISLDEGIVIYEYVMARVHGW